MSFKRPAILFLLSDTKLKDIYLARFERDGWEVGDATSLLDAERKAVQLRPAILMVDQSFIDDVKTTLARLQSLPTLLKTKLIVTGTHLSRATVSDMLKAGVHDIVMTAQVTPQELSKRLHKLID